VLLGIENQEYTHTFLVPSNAGLVFEMALQQLQTRFLSSALLSQYGRLGLNQWYITGAVVYHCRQLVELYPRTIAHSFESTGARQIDSDRIVLSNQIEPYFEFEALVTAVVRVFETARYLVWRVYGTKSGPPRNFQGVIEQAQFPGEIANKKKEWVNTYMEAKGYRDCIQHNAHFGARLPFSIAETVSGEYGSLLVQIPDNPEAKSYDRFTYEKKLDALDYGWTLTSRVFRFTDELLSCVEMRRE